jgi:hypothetical protein
MKGNFVMNSPMIADAQARPRVARRPANLGENVKTTVVE